MVLLLPPSKTASYRLFHDESGFTNDARYGVHGLLAVPQSSVRPLYEAIRRIREEHRYFGELHYSQLATSRPERSAPWQTSNDILNLFCRYAFNEVKFKAFVVDFHHVDFDRNRYPKRKHAYRRFSITVAKSLIAWCLRGNTRVVLKAFTDAGNPSASWLRRDGDLFAKFHEYVSSECNRAKVKERKKFYPDVEFSHRLLAIPSSPSKCSEDAAFAAGCESLEEMQESCEFIQVVDLLCGCIQAALAVNATNDGKVRLAEALARTIAEQFDMPWHLAVRRSRCMSVSMFPGTGRMPYAISLSGIRALGINAMREDPQLAAKYGPKYGFRLDAVLPGQLTMDLRDS